MPAEAIERYLVRWNPDATQQPPKAYPTDECGQEEWQPLDFMKRLHLPYPITEAGPAGEVFRLGR